MHTNFLILFIANLANHVKNLRLQKDYHLETINYFCRNNPTIELHTCLKLFLKVRTPGLSSQVRFPLLNIFVLK